MDTFSIIIRIMNIFEDFFPLAQALGAAGSLAALLAIFQSGEELYAYQEGIQCDSIGLLTNNTFEWFMDISLPISLFLYILFHGLSQKSEHFKQFANIVKSLVVHIPVCFIIIQTVILTQSDCTATPIPADQRHFSKDPIELMAWSFVILGISFTLSTMFGTRKSQNNDSENDVKGIISTNVVEILDSVMRLVTFALIAMYVNDDTKIVKTTHVGTCQTQIDSIDFELVPSAHRKAWSGISYTFSVLCLVELSIQVLAFVSHLSNNTPGMARQILNNRMVLFSMKVFTAVSRLVMCLAMAGFVMERLYLECNVFEPNDKFKTIIVLGTFTFIPSLLSQQLEWENIGASIEGGIGKLFSHGRNDVDPTKSNMNYDNLLGN